MDNNLKIDGKSIRITINPELYSLEVIYSAAYVFLNRAYVLLDGDPKEEIIIVLKSKTGEDLEKLSGEFLNELINYGDYSIRSEQTKAIREMILQRALITNDSAIVSDPEFDKILKELEDEGDTFPDDPEGIAIPWEEKYGKKNENQHKAE